MILFLQRYRVVALAVLMMSMAVGGAAIGAYVNGLRLKADHLVELAGKDKIIGERDGQIAEQNAGIAVLKEKTDGAEARRLTAEQFAAAALQRAGSRAAKVAASTATNCDGVLKENWGSW